jgi:nucleotide-binding universal stress UspA family protein
LTQIKAAGHRNAKVLPSYLIGETVMHAKTLLIVTGIDHDDEDLLQAAHLAEAEQVHLTAIVVSCVPPPPVGDRAGDIASLYAVEWDQEFERLNARAADLYRRLGDRGLQAEIQVVYCLQGSLAEEVGKHACYADIVVIGQAVLKDDFLRKRVLDGALFASPTPVLLLGDATATLRPKTVLVAWNATLEAGAAVRSALDILAHADSVRLAAVDPDARPYAMGEEPGADMARFLARHHANVTVDTLASGGKDPAIVLQRHARDIGADLIVMGAYGHSRMRERFFGGTTETMTKNIGTPVFMAH